MTSPRWSTVTKIIVASALAIAAILLLFTFRQMIAPTIVAFLLTFVLGYPVNWVQQRTGWARTASILSVYAIFAAALLLLGILIVPRFDTIVVSLQSTVGDLLDGVQSRVDAPLVAIGPLRLSFNEAVTQAESLLQGLFSAVTSNPMGIARGVTQSAISAVYALVLNFWLLKDGHKLQRFSIDLVPTEYQEEIRRLSNDLGDVWTGFLQGQMMLGLVIGLITWVCLLVLGMPNAGGLALLAGLLEFLPSIGPMISGLIAFTLALFQGSTWMPVGPFVFAVIVGIVYTIIGQVESVYFIPRLVGGRVKLHPAVTFVGIIGGAMTFGVLGILLAAPVIASARVLLVYIARKLADLEPFEVDRATQAILTIPGVIGGRKIDAVIFDLDGTLAQIDTTAVDWAADNMRWLDRLLPPDARRMLARHFLSMLEGPINFLLNLLWRWHWHESIERIRPTLDRLRGFPPADELTPQPDVAATLTRISRTYRLALISSRGRDEVESFLVRSNLNSGLFDTVLAREDVKNILPHVDPLTRVASQFGIGPHHMLVVSDSEVGLRAARAAEMVTAGVTSGMALPDNVRDADLVVPQTADLGDFL